MKFNILIITLLLPMLFSCASGRSASYSSLRGGTPIFGNHKIEVEQMYQFVRSRNPSFEREVAEAFYDVGRLYGIRGDIALCQAIIETGWFRFDNGTAVRPDSHNYCGLGVRKNGQQGCKFDNIRDGVTAMIQHLYAYACAEDLPKGERLLDPRFRLVSRGSAKSWEALSGKWAMNPNYGNNILKIYGQMTKHPVDRTKNKSK